MHSIAFLQDLAVVMCVAAVATILFRQFKQPVVLGYILAGVVIGPHTPPFELIHGEETIKTLAELGVIFLMFSLGLEFSLGKLRKVGAAAFIAAALEILLMMLAGYELGRIFGWSKMDSIFLGAILAISSTTIIIKALEGLGKTKEPFAGLIFGILIVEDVLAILMIVLLTGFAMTGEINPAEVGMTILGLSSFLGILLVGGLILVPRLLNYVAKFKSDEMLLITVVGLCFGVSLLTVHLGYSVALGAFLIGAIIAEARQIVKIETLMHPVRDLFSAVFFVSIGLLIDPALIVKYAGPILAITVVVVVGKVFSCSLGCFVSGNDRKTSMKVGMSLAQIGEFSFIIAALGLSLKTAAGDSVTSDFLYPIAVAVSAITTLLTPYLIRSSDNVVHFFDRIAPRPLLQAMEAYTQWVGSLAQRGGAHLERKILSKLGLQIAVNLLLVTGIFISAAFLRKKAVASFPDFPGGDDGVKALLWLAALIVSFPLLIAIWRKTEVGAMVISEMSVNPAAAGAKAPAIQAMIANVITVVGTGVIILILLLLSSALLPSRNVLLLVLVIMIVSGFLLYRGSVKLYAGAQFALHDTFAQPADPAPHHAPEAPLPSLLKHAQLETIEIRPDTRGAGKMISELALRAETGASVVGIERNGESLINPPPHEELHDGDQVLLIGTSGQLEAARKLLTSGKTA
jgi:CPA2 family monovalent cation:H+ antiporter-2